MVQNKTQTIMNTIDSFPVLPSVVTRVMEITADPDSSIDDLMRVIQTDPSLTASILKIANSALFGHVMAVASLQEALMILGFNEIQNIVLTKAVFNSFKQINTHKWFDIRRFWEHSFLCGLAAKIISSKTPLAKNELFISGLIHDIGKLVIYLSQPEDFKRIVEASFELNFRTTEAEKKIVGITHEEIGASLLKRWMFPQNLLTAVEFHHRPENATQMTSFAIVIFLADYIAHQYEAYKNDMHLDFKMEHLKMANVFKIAGTNNIDISFKEMDAYKLALVEKAEEESDVLNLLLM